MKHAICAVLVAGSALVMAEEPKQSPTRGLVQTRQSTCYFIRTLRPVMPEGDARRSGFILLQSRVTGVESGPVCTTRQPLLRAQRMITTGPVVNQPGGSASR